jgi:hypothetical protein
MFPNTSVGLTLHLVSEFEVRYGSSSGALVVP